MSFEDQQDLIARAAALAALLISAARALHRGWVAMRTRAELRALSDRTLKDIGLSRGQVDSLFR